MPGWTAAAEAIQRGEHRYETLKHACTLGRLFSRSISMGSSDTVNTLGFSISLMATLRKQLSPYLQQKEYSVVPGSHRFALSGESEEEGWSDKTRKMFRIGQAIQLIPHLLKVVRVLDQKMLLTGVSASSCSCGDASTSKGEGQCLQCRAEHQALCCWTHTICVIAYLL